MGRIMGIEIKPKESSMTNELLVEVSILREKCERYEQLLRSKDLSIQCFKASADMFREQNEKYEKAIEDIKSEINKEMMRRNYPNWSANIERTKGFQEALEIINKYIGGAE